MLSNILTTYVNYWGLSVWIPLDIAENMGIQWNSESVTDFKKVCDSGEKCCVTFSLNLETH